MTRAKLKRKGTKAASSSKDLPKKAAKTSNVKRSKNGKNKSSKADWWAFNLQELNKFSLGLRKNKKKPSSKSKQRGRERESSRSSARREGTAANNRRTKVSKFQLQLPSREPKPIESVPWKKKARSATKKCLSVSSSRSNITKRPRLPTDDIPEPLLAFLDDELLAFAEYVRLNDTEQAARRLVMSRVNTMAKELFAERHYYHLRSDDQGVLTAAAEQPEEVRVQVFGSFATLPVCAFHSDVDLALWGVMPVMTERPNQSSTSKASPSKDEDSSKQQKKQRVEKWRDALASVDADSEADRKETLKVAAAAAAAADDCNIGNGKVDPTRANSATAIASNELPLFAIDRVGDNETVQCESTNATSEATSEPSLFVIDRVGESSLTTDDKVEGAKESLEQQPLRAQDDSVAVLSAADAPAVDHKRDDDNNEVIDLTIESDDDTADKLETFQMRETRNETAPDKQQSPVISLSSSNDDTDGESSCYEEGEELIESEDNVSRMEVSMVAPTEQDWAPSAKGPTGYTKLKCLEALGSLCRRLRKSSFASRVQFIKHARVPIIKMETSMGFEVDVAVGGHNGADTSHFAASQVERFQSFSCVVLFLKVLLAQQNLDTPYSGGIGSYKLYVLVSYHIQKHLALGGSDRPSEILLSFLFRYGFVSGHNVHDIARTLLSKDCVLNDGNGATADMSNVFLIEHCVRLFMNCWMRLWKCRRRWVREKEPRKVSVLADLVDMTWLQRERQECTKRAKTLKGMKSASHGHSTRLISSTSANEKSLPFPRDLTAEQLIAGYNGSSDLKRRGNSDPDGAGQSPSKRSKKG